MTQNNNNQSPFHFFDQLFGSKTRVKLLRLFLLTKADERFYLREIARNLDEHINSVRRELDNLESLELIQKAAGESGDARIYYQVNTRFVLYQELRSLLMKSQLLLRSSLVDQIGKIGAISYLVLTGMFTGNLEVDTDMLVVGRVNHQKLADLIRNFEKELGKEIRYTILPITEFLYRYQLTDRFLYTIFENEKIILIDEITERVRGEIKDHSRKRVAVKVRN